MVKHKIKALELHEPRVRRLEGTDQEPDPLGKTVYPGEKGCALPSHLCINLFTSDRYAQLKTLPQNAISPLKGIRRIDPNSPEGKGMIPYDKLIEGTDVGIQTLSMIAKSMNPKPDEAVKFRGKMWYSPGFAARVKEKFPPEGTRSTFKLFDPITWRSTQKVVSMLAEIGVYAEWEMDGVRFFRLDAADKFKEAYPDSLYNEKKPRR